MNLERLEALSNIKSPRGLGWTDLRSRSPKALGDLSGLVGLSRIGANTGAGLQDFDYSTIAKINICNDLVWTCINLVSSTTALAKLKVVIDDGKQITAVPDHPLQTMLDFPNPSMTQFDLIQSYVTHQNLYGTIGVLLLRGDMTQDCTICMSQASDECLHKFYVNTTGPVVGMMPVHPSCIIQDWIEMDGKKRTIFFYTPDPSRKFPIHPDNILTDPFYNTDHGWYGISPTWLLKRWIDLDMSMTHQVKELFDNGSIPSMIVSMKPGQNFTYEQEPETLMQMMKEKWMAQFSSHGQTQKSPAFVYGDVSVERIQEKIDEELSKGLYYEIQGRICATYGVPSTLYEVGMKFGSQRASAEQAEKDFYNRTISKILKRIELKINRLVVPSYATKGLKVIWDLSELGIADFLISSKKDGIKKDWELGLTTRDETRIALGKEPIGGELGNDLYRLTVMSDGSSQPSGSGTKQDNQLTVDNKPAVLKD